MPEYPFSGVIIADDRDLHADGAAPAEDSMQTSPPALSELLDRFSSLFDEVILVAVDPVALLAHDALIVSDHFAPAGLLSGIHAGLFAAGRSHAFVTAARLPLPPSALIDAMLNAASLPNDVVLLEAEAGWRPLPGVYATSALKSLTHDLKQERPAVRKWLRRNRVYVIEEPEKG